MTNASDKLPSGSGPTFPTRCWQAQLGPALGILCGEAELSLGVVPPRTGKFRKNRTFSRACRQNMPVSTGGIPKFPRRRNRDFFSSRCGCCATEILVASTDRRRRTSERQMAHLNWSEQNRANILARPFHRPARARMRRALRRCGASSICPFSDATPLSALSKAAITAFACATSSADGVNAALMISI